MNTIKAHVLKMFELFSGIIDSIDNLQNALIYNNINMLTPLRDSVGSICEEENTLVEEFIKEAKENPSFGKYILIPTHICKIGENIQKLSDVVSIKISEEILFSDKALDEINFLFERLKDILKNTNDMILARNIIVAGYIKESESEMSRIANDFSTKHEERLIEGLCLPKASSKYLDMMDSMKVIAWHAKEIAISLR